MEFPLRVSARTCIFPRKFLESPICESYLISKRISGNSWKGQVNIIRPIHPVFLSRSSARALVLSLFRTHVRMAIEAAFPTTCSQITKKERKKTDTPREGWEDGTPPPHRDFLRRGESVVLAVTYPWASASSYLSSQSVADSRCNPHES